MAFLLEEECPWPPHLIDGFSSTQPPAPKDDARIQKLRQQLQEERVVSWFRTPADLEARVSTAVSMARLQDQLNLEPIDGLPSNLGEAPGSGTQNIAATIIAASDRQCALKLDLKTPWWSTRLYWIALLAEQLTKVRRILIVRTIDKPVKKERSSANSPSRRSCPRSDRR